jgi:hypothetical protein
MTESVKYTHLITKLNYTIALILDAIFSLFHIEWMKINETDQDASYKIIWK